MVRVTLLQVEMCDDEPASERVPRVADLIRGERGQSDLVILPELWHVGAHAAPAQIVASAEPVDGPLATALADAARSAGVWLHGGSFPERADGRRERSGGSPERSGGSPERSDGRRERAHHAVYNTSVLFAPDGTRRATYRKIHPFGFGTGEAEEVSGGSELVVADTPLGRTGLSTCYDLRFPEVYRALLDLGAEAFLIPAGWPTVRIETWELLARARAIENQAFVFACNAGGVSGGVPLGGNSLAIGPDGSVLGRTGGGADRLSVNVDPAQAVATRREFPVLADRRLSGPQAIGQPAGALVNGTGSQQ